MALATSLSLDKERRGEDGARFKLEKGTATQMTPAYRMRILLLAPLLLVSVGTTATSMLMIHRLVKEQVQTTLAADLDHSVTTFDNLELQRRAMLQQQSALMADLPSLKALMTTQDERTIRDAGSEFWRVSGADLFALAGPSGHVIAVYVKGSLRQPQTAGMTIQNAFFHGTDPRYLVLDGSLYEIASQPLYFGPSSTGFLLGSVVSGYAIDEQVAREVSQVAAADVVFTANGQAVASTLDGKRLQLLMASHAARQGVRSPVMDLRLGREQYLAKSVDLSPLPARGNLRLLVLKSYNQANLVASRLNRWVVAIGIVTLLIVGFVVIVISRSVTQPLEALAKSVVAFGSGDAEYRLPTQGAREVQEVSAAFRQMREEIKIAERDRLESERLATIGRMAYSISHDLRHYLSAVYANAEFLLEQSIPEKEKAELLAEVRVAVYGMTDMIESLLIFSRTGRALHRSEGSLLELVERVVLMVKNHPEASRSVIEVESQRDVIAWIDIQKVERAIYNLLLNACQATKAAGRSSRIRVQLSSDENLIHIRICDNGPGVPESVRASLFEPFVSEGKENGVGLGLTLAHHIAEEHGGRVVLESTEPGRTVFLFTLLRSASPQPAAETKISTVVAV